MAVGGHNALVDLVEPVLGTPYGDAAGEREVAVAGQERLAGDMDGDERGRACGLHGDGWPGKSQLVRDPAGQEVGATGHAQVPVGHAP